jgi:hypothetical protein
MIQVWIGKDDADHAAALTGKLEKLVKERCKGRDLSDGEQMDLLRGFVIFIDAARRDEATRIAKEQQAEHVMLGCIPAQRRQAAVDGYGMNPDAKNTIVVNRGARATAIFADLEAKDFDRVVKALDEALDKK